MGRQLVCVARRRRIRWNTPCHEWTECEHGEHHVQEHEDNDLERKRQENIERVFKRKSTPENLTTLLKETGNLPNKETLDNWVNEFHKEGLFTEQEILNAFKLYDEDGNGYITREE